MRVKRRFILSSADFSLSESIRPLDFGAVPKICKIKPSRWPNTGNKGSGCESPWSFTDRRGLQPFQPDLLADSRLDIMTLENLHILPSSLWIRIDFPVEWQPQTSTPTRTWRRRNTLPTRLVLPRLSKKFSSFCRRVFTQHIHEGAFLSSTWLLTRTCTTLDVEILSFLEQIISLQVRSLSYSDARRCYHTILCLEHSTNLNFLICKSCCIYAKGLVDPFTKKLLSTSSYLVSHD